VKVIIAHTETKGPLGDSHLGEVSTGQGSLALCSSLPAPDLGIMNPLESYMSLESQKLTLSPTHLAPRLSCYVGFRVSLDKLPSLYHPTNRESLKL
jgi:hypothetical protein